jgi:hypothetical protein
LVSSGLKDERSNFSYKYGNSLSQEDDTSCGFLAFINASQILTGPSGQSLAQAHCTCCVEVIRVFFVLWFIKLAESHGAIQKGYLAEVLNRNALADGDRGGGQGRKRQLDSKQIQQKSVGGTSAKKQKSSNCDLIATKAATLDVMRLNSDGASYVKEPSRPNFRQVIARMKSLPSEQSVDLEAVRVFQRLAKEIPCFTRLLPE